MTSQMRCLGCSAVFAAGRLWCPKCQTWASMDAIREDAMPKITTHGGASNGAPERPVEPDAVELPAPAPRAAPRPALPRVAKEVLVSTTDAEVLVELPVAGKAVTSA